jgi:tetratricopeptide (TPR) repeat protein
MMRRLWTRSRVREARGRLAKHSTPLNFALLAQECALQGDLREAERVSREGLALFAGNTELEAVAARVRKHLREERLQSLRRELAETPRDGLSRELVDLLLESGELSRAEEAAHEWLQRSDGPEARLAVARTRAERFFADRGREAGQRAFEALDQLDELRPNDPRSWRLRLDLCAAIGAWRDARRAAARLLELEPGDPELEARFRALDAMANEAIDVRQALREVEKTGRLLGDGPVEGEQTRASIARDVRPALRALAHAPEVRAALYLRGATALVQGPKGATAERTARHVREVVQSARTTARRLGLGRVTGLELEGAFGTLQVATTEADAAALWCNGRPAAALERALLDLAGWTPQGEVGKSNPGPGGAR